MCRRTDSQFRRRTLRSVEILDGDADGKNMQTCERNREAEGLGSGGPGLSLELRAFTSSGLVPSWKGEPQCETYVEIGGKGSSGRRNAHRRGCAIPRRGKGLISTAISEQRSW